MAGRIIEHVQAHGVDKQLEHALLLIGYRLFTGPSI